MMLELIVELTFQLLNIWYAYWICVGLLSDLIYYLFGIFIYGIWLHVRNSQHTSLAAILLAGL